MLAYSFCSHSIVLLSIAANWAISIHSFNYLDLHLPTRVLDKKLKLLLIRTDIEKERSYQQQRSIELETELLTTPVIYRGEQPEHSGYVAIGNLDATYLLVM